MGILKIKNLEINFENNNFKAINDVRALILNPKILILDEPTSALDFVTQNEILNLLCKRKCAKFRTSHRDFLRRQCQR